MKVWSSFEILCLAFCLLLVSCLVHVFTLEINARAESAIKE